jgi:hypothetical protein
MNEKEIEHWRRSLRSRGIMVELRTGAVPQGWLPPIEDCRKVWPNKDERELRRERHPIARLKKAWAR